LTTPILKITEAANGQVDQYLTYNEALRALESSTNNFYVVDMSAGDVTLTDSANVNPALNYIFSRNQVFRTSGNTVARVLTVPQSKRLFMVQNSGTFALTVKRGTAEITVAAAVSAIFYCDGTANGLIAIVNSGNFVSGPVNSANNEIALFDGATGKLLKRGSVVGTAAYANVTSFATDTTAGSLTAVRPEGIFGLGNTSNQQNLPSNGAGSADLQAIPTGLYIALSASFASPPFGSADVWLDVHRIGTTQAQQTAYITGATPRKAIRTYTSGAWSSWREEWNTGNTSADVRAMLSAANNAAIRSAISASSLPPYTLGTVPSAAANNNLLIVITDLTGGREPCYSDGANWLRCSDKTIAS
jgi:hypothetical protein